VPGDLPLLVQRSSEGNGGTVTAVTRSHATGMVLLNGLAREAALDVAQQVIRHLHLPGRPFLPSVPARALIADRDGRVGLTERVLRTLADADRLRAAPSPCLHEFWWHWGEPPQVGDVGPEDAPVQLGEHRIWELAADLRTADYLPRAPLVLEHALIAGDGAWVYLSSGQGEGVLATTPDLMRRVRGAAPWSEAEDVASFLHEMDHAAPPVTGWGHDLVAHVYGLAGPPAT
jgi:hypothetical protein